MEKMKILTIIVGTKNSRIKIKFNFEKDKPTYEVIKDYVLIESNILNYNVIQDILISIIESKMDIRSKNYGYHYEFNEYFWILKFEYITKKVYYKSGSDILPNDWSRFVESFKELLPKEVGILC